MIAMLLPTLSAGIPLSCQRDAVVVQDGVHDYGPLVDKPPIMRVLLINNVREAQLSVYGCYQITGSLTNIIDQGQGLQKAKISVTNGGVNIGNKRYDTSELRIASRQDGDIELNGLRYRGEIRILQQDNNKFSVIEE